MTSANRFELLYDRASEWRRRMDLIRAARRFVYVVTYFVDEDKYAAELLEALVEACKRGVDVFLGIDAFGQRLGRQVLTQAMEARLQARLDDVTAAGGTVRFYQPPTRLQRALGGGQHIKIQLTEAGEALLGSSNISGRSFDHWKELSFSLWGPVVLPIYDTIGALFRGATTDAHRTLVVGAPPQVATPLDVDYVWHDPNTSLSPLAPIAGVHNPLTQRLVDSIARAERSLVVTSFYFKPCEALAQAIVSAAKRGVHVEVFHSHRDALIESDMPWMSAAADYARFLEAGVRIYESQQGEHSKILLVDDSELAIGSYNFEHAADDRLAELMVFTRDSRVITDVRAILDGMRTDPDNTRVDASTWGALPTALRARTRLFGSLRRWF